MDEVKLSLLDDNKERLYDALQHVPYIPDLIANLQKDGVNLVLEACMKGYTDILALLEGHDVKLTSQPHEDTPMQAACRYGNADVVEFLLLRDADLTERNLLPWSESSPFYLATRYGHHDVLNELMKHSPIDVLELVKGEEVRGCLLYAACQGGDLLSVKKWLAPDIQIDSPIKLVDSFEDCELKTPLNAACEGGHLDVATFLAVEMGAKLTRAICERFPEITGTMLKGFFIPVQSNNEEDEIFPLYTATMNKCRLEYIHPDWLLPYHVTLVDLDISHNNLTELPRSVPWDLQNLQTLNVSQNRIRELCGPDSQDKENLCQSLEEVNISNNEIEKVSEHLFQISSLVTLKLDHNKLSYLVKSIHQNVDEQLDQLSVLHRESRTPVRWECSNLTLLDISHNTLQLLPTEIHCCSSLKKLLLNNNKLITLPAAWNCPLEILNVSDNQLVRFPVDVDQYWVHSLLYLKLSHNCLEEITESIVKLVALVDLDASHNQIERLPPALPDVWRCTELYSLNLTHNRLGVTNVYVKPRFSLSAIRKRSMVSDDRKLAFPTCLSTCLKELHLADNNLDVVPDSISQLLALEVLDLSRNTLIHELPKSLGYLQSCRLIKMEGLKLNNVSEQLTTGPQNKTKAILSVFLETLRCSSSYYKMKAVVIGKKDKGKTTLVNRLAGKRHQMTIDREGIVKEEITLTKRRSSGLALLQRQTRPPDIRLSLWDMAGDEAYALTHQCVFTRNSLYLLVWDIWTIDKELDLLKAWLYNIKASTPDSRIIIVGTFLDKLRLTPQEQSDVVNRLRAKINKHFPLERETVHLCPVSGSTGEGFEDLRYAMYEIASSMDEGGKRDVKLIGRKVPKSYLTAERLVQDEAERRTKNKEAPFLTQQEFDQLISKIPDTDNDLESSDERANVTKFLVETGSLLHYADQLGAINTLYFLDPAWLCEALVKVLLKGDRYMESGKIPKSDVQALYQNDDRFPNAYLDQYIKLLERFEIAVTVKNQQLYFPSKLPEQRPGMELPSQDDQSKRISRLYKMAVIPSGFWTRLLTRLMMKVEDFASDSYFHLPTIGPSFRSSILTSTIKRHSPATNLMSIKGKVQGLSIQKPITIYWREGMFVSYDGGYFQVEPVQFPCPEGEQEHRASALDVGILITEQSRDNDFGIMGIIVDEIEDIIQDYYPGLLEPDQWTMRNRLERYALCRVCFEDKSKLKHDIDHFTVEMCSRLLSSGDEIVCRRNGAKLHLPDLVPDLLMNELPRHFILDEKQLKVKECRENLLGEGVSGAVFRGCYGNKEVAVKLYRSDIRYSPRKAQEMSCDSGTATMDSSGSSSDSDDKEEDYYNFRGKGIPLDLDEAESIKAFQALKGMRQEVALTSRLQHPCVIALVGILFRPKLMMALELAPFGSLRTVIDGMQVGRPFDKLRDKQKIFPLIFSKEMTFKILYQIAKGLHYLHSNGIIYKDLKTDNVLVTSKSLDDFVNVKLSDYGISKYSWSGGSVGLVGTPGYQAPEIIDGLPYDEKVDIYAYSMVIYEVMSGRRPFEDLDNLAQITKAIKVQGRKPDLKDHNVYSQFPYLEDLMQKCWNNAAVERPPANLICSKRSMESTHFLAQAAAFLPDKGGNFCVETLLGAPKDDQSVIWMWEWYGQETSRYLTILDMETSGYAVYKKMFGGQKVTCMARVGEKVWVGTEAEEIEIYGTNLNGSLMKEYIIQTGSVPVQILVSTDNTEKCRRNPIEHVYIGLEDGRLILFQTAPDAKVPLCRKSVKAPEGFKPRKILSFKTDTLFCMTFAKGSSEIWVSVNHAIEVIAKSIFMVESDLRIKLDIVKELCQIPASLNITQMVQVNDCVWCLVKTSPFVLQFDVQTHKCLRLLCCEDQNPYNKLVLQEFVSGHDLPVYVGSSGNDQESSRLSRIRRPAPPPPPPPSSPCSPSVEMERTSSEESNEDVNSLLPPPLPPRPRHSLQAMINDDVDPKDEASDKLLRTIRENVDSTSSLSVNSSSSKTDMSLKRGTIHGFNRPSHFSSVLKTTSENDSKSHTLPINIRGPAHSSRRGNQQIDSKSDMSKSLSSPDVPPLPPKSPKQTTGNKPLESKVSNTFPRSSKTDMFEAVNDFNVIINSISCVGTSLWLGRSTADICVVDLDRNPQSNSHFGKVISILRDVQSKSGGLQNDEKVILNNVGNYVVAANQVKGENCAFTKVVSWDKIDAGDIKRFHKYWQGIKQMESDIIKRNT